MDWVAEIRGIRMRLHRPCIGIELDPASFAVACDRLQQEVEALGLFA